MKNSKSLILIDFDDQFFLDVSIKLKKIGVHIPCIITDKITTFKKYKIFDHTQFFDPLNFAYPRLIKKLNVNNSDCLSTQIINKSIEYENLFLTISDRLNFFPISVRERKKLYQELFLYWYSYLEKTHPDAVVFTSTPHMGFQIIIYAIAKILKIKTIYLYRTLIQNKILLLTDYKKIKKVPKNYLENKNKKDFVKIIGLNFYKKVFIPSIWLKHSDSINRKAINRNILFQINEFVKTFIRFFRFIFYGQPTSVFYYNNGINKFFIGFLCIWVNFKVNLLRKYYSSLSSKIFFNKKFVFFPLHFQPERTTCPEGGLFENQLIAVDILSKSVPKDWIIYIKEHPRQFELNDPRRFHYRDRDYYSTLLRYKNVKLIRIEESSEPLIENAIFTVTITGSSGWQSLLKNKSCMAFGNPWYSSCRSCYNVNSIKECKNAIKNIVNKNPSDVEKDVLKFLAFNKNIFITSTNGYYYAVQSGTNYQDLVNNLANNLIK